MVRTILVTVLAVAVVSTAFWGYQEHQEKNSILIKAENNYQRAFHDLTYHLDQLHDEIGSTLAMNSRDQLSPSLAEVWRITSMAQNDLGQLPLALMPFSKTEEYLYKIGQFSYRNAIRDLDNEPLSEEEYQTLEQLYEQSGEIQKEMRQVQSMVLNENLRWMDVELALASEEEPLDNAIVNGFKIVDEKVEGFSEVEWGSELPQLQQNDEALKERLNGEQISEEEAKEIALNFVQLENVEVEIEETGEGLAYESFSIKINDPEHEVDIYMDISQKGGHPIWLLQDRQVGDAAISLNEASERAKELLERNDINDMQLVDSKQYNSVGVFNFAYLKDNVRVYPDSIIIDVSLEDGEIIGYEASAYLTNHRDRDVEEPSISLEEAKESLNPALEVMEHHVAMIKNDLGEEVLAYEFFGVINNDTYRIFINAANGEEEKVEKLDHAEPVYRST
ncbi:germination protein YpeB [Anaerobacillus arseniciselenatis]|uniref:Germination protein YpeB n=1 Tax=Anaerobacillus arseniciselenatis TaxID=85682 RepID=A0A1S2LU77_9BACI|nr:germination protein YpeB [Anaerobacillus arseniciselenatis]OIJ15874.1 germination protein YpeB [Anaerobacillus arseniciselenatis]